MPIDPVIGGALIGGAIDGLGMIGQKKREKRAINNQKELNKHGQELAMKTWNETNYGAQMEHMTKAGLSPGLMYGGSGAGGATTSAGSGGSAPAPQQMNVGGMMGGAQLGLLKAQKENIEADTANKQADAGYTSGAKTNETIANTKNRQENTKLQYEQGRGVFMENLIKEYGLGMKQDKYEQNANHYGEIRIYENSPTGQKIQLGPRKIQQELDNLEVEERAAEAGIKLTEERAREIYNSIIRKWVETGLSAIDVLKLIKTGKLGK